MANSLNHNLNEENLLTSIVESDNFVNLNSNLQNKIIDAVDSDKKRDGGLMGRFLGNRKENAAIHSSLLICGFLIFFLIIDCVHSYCSNTSINMELVNTIIPVVTISLGYIFGKGSN